MGGTKSESVAKYSFPHTHVAGLSVSGSLLALICPGSTSDSLIRFGALDARKGHARKSEYGGLKGQDRAYIKRQKYTVLSHCGFRGM